MLTINKARSEKCQAGSTTVKIYSEKKIQNVNEFHQIENELPLILHVSMNQIWAVALLCNVTFLLIVKDT